MPRSARVECLARGVRTLAGRSRLLHRSGPVDTATRVERRDGAVQIEHGPGDGVVPAWSATARGAMPSVSVAHQGHSTLPLDPEVIGWTVRKVGECLVGSGYQPPDWLGSLETVSARLTGLRLGGQAGEREDVLAQLDAANREGLPVSTLVSLVPWG